MTSLVIAEHDNNALKSATLNTVTAASKLNRPITLLVVGHECDTVIESASHITGVSSVLCAKSIHYQHALAENIATLIADNATPFTHIFAPATTFGKNCLPRAAALKDSAVISDIIEVIDAATYVRPIYA